MNSQPTLQLRSDGGPVSCRASGGRAGAAAFSLIEIMVAVALLSVIILGLLAMFSQTQRLFRIGLTQSDIMEGGRLAADTLRADLETLRPTYVPQGKNFDVARLSDWEPTAQRLAENPELRTNVVQYFYFVSRENQDWIHTLYWPQRVVGGVYTLFRAQAVSRSEDLESVQGLIYNWIRPDANFATLPSAFKVRPVADGVVHLRLTTYDPGGWLQFYSLAQTNNILAVPDPGAADTWKYRYVSNAVPASINLELALLEPGTAETLVSIPDPAAQLRYLSNHVGRVHVFRQRIPIRAVDLSAYP